MINMIETQILLRFHMSKTQSTTTILTTRINERSTILAVILMIIAFSA
jgi:hypothetical protein